MAIRKKNILVRPQFLRLVFLFLFSIPALAPAAQGPADSDPIYREDQIQDESFEGVTPQQVERVKACKRLLKEVDRVSLRKTLKNLSSSDYPEEMIQILEAMARTYKEMVEEQQVVELKKKEWLHSMIKLNMGYLQMGGLNVKAPNDTALNKMIRRKLKEQLPEELTSNTELFYSVDEMQNEALP